MNKFTIKEKLPYCLNCNTELSREENYCPVCGQENASRKIKLKQFISDFLSDFFTFDSKIFKSLTPLFLKPGFLTYEFNSGKRIRYIAPLRLYIFISIIYFFVLSIDSGTTVFPDVKSDGTNWSFDVGEGEPVVFTDYDSLQNMIDSLGTEKFAEEIGASQGIVRLVISQFAKVISKRGEGFTELIFKNVSILMFVLLPIFAFLLLIFFGKKKHYYLEHLVHSFHLHAFIFLFLSLYLLFSIYIYDAFSFFIATMLSLLYIFFSLKKVYQYKVWGTFWREFTLMFTYSIVLFFGIIASVMLSILFY